MHSAISSEGQGSLNSPKAACWSDSEVDALVNYLHIHCAEWGDSGNFKDNMYAAAAEHIKDLHISGKIKDAKSVRNKWIQVCHILPYIST